ncbi:MAG: SusC/RagA family TonB-linked outer membrane protein [Capnocytophaga felis]|nr:SusC/RagA family TonB-linked outer membrane protein [Capnocytophaga felis]
MRSFFIFVFLGVTTLSNGIYSQTSRVISGRVISDEDKQPLPGAAVSVPSKSQAQQTREKDVILSLSLGTVTDFDGLFSLKVPKDVTQFSVSFLGYKTKVVNILPNKDYYEISLTEEYSELEGVIVTGYQKIEARRLTASVTKLETKDIIQAGVSSIDQLLAGQVAGMQTNIASGSPGEISKIRIRGTASLQGTQDPLWVIDGLPLDDNIAPDLTTGIGQVDDAIDALRSYSIAGINPEDIENVTILKDAAATAIYGARAANGVIVVTTKKGKKGEMNVNISANTFIGFRPDFKRLNLMNSSEKVDFELAMARRADLTYHPESGEVYRILNQAGEYSNYQNTGIISTETQSKIDALRNNHTQWDKILFRDSFNSQYTASISGGSDDINYYFSLGYFDEKGTTTGTGFNRFTITTNNSFKISDKLKINTSILGSQSQRDSYVSDSGAFTNPLYYSRRVNPYLTPYNEDGSFNYDREVGIDSRTENILFNFLEERQNTSNKLKNLSLKAVFDLEYKLVKNLTFLSQIGLQVDRDIAEKYAKWESYFARNRKRMSRYGSPTDPSYYLQEGDIIYRDNAQFFQYNWKNTLQYNFKANERNEFDLLVGSELRRNLGETTYEKIFGYNPQTLTHQTIDKEGAPELYDEFKIPPRVDKENAYASFFGTASYTYNNRYTFFGSIRYDGSNLFGVDPKYKYLPLWAISGAWTVSEEDFLRNNKYISYLKLRASYGLQGNIDRSTSPFILGDYRTTNLSANNVTSIKVTLPPNDKLRWETTHNYDFGVDLSLFSNRIRFSGEFYKRISKDLLGKRTLPYETGFASSVVNWAQITNKGFGITLTTQNIKTRDFNWTTSFVFSKNTNNVDKVDVDVNTYSPSLQGYPVNAMFVFKTNGLDSNGLPLFVDKEGNSHSAKDFFKIVKNPANGFISTSYKKKELLDLLQYAGNKDPEFTGGLTNVFKYKNIDLTINGHLVYKQMMRKTPPYEMVNLHRGPNMSREVLSAWTPENTNTSLPRIIGATTVNELDYEAFKGIQEFPYVYQSLDIWAKEMTYFRVSSVRLGYALDNELTKKMGLSSMRFSLEGRNLFVISNDYTGFFNPETYGNIYVQPIPTSVAFGVNVTF